MKHLFALFLVLASFSGAANAHEFWIDPVAFGVAPGETVVADLRVGEMFRGSAQSFLDHRVRRHETIFDGTRREIPARMGDRPAISVASPDAPGLLVLVHETADSVITWDDFARFENFVRHKDAEWTLERHAERGLERDGTSEIYSRYAKSLIAVGDGRGADVEVGMTTEIVALENPYTGDMTDGLDVLVLYEGRPRAETQVEIFEKDEDGNVAVSTVKTDGEGRATVPVTSGRTYQLDAVVLRETDPETHRGAVWESLWANLTFRLP